MKDDADAPRSPLLETGMKNSPPTVDLNHRIGRRMRWIAVLGLMVLIFVVSSIRYLPLSISDSILWHERSSQGHRWQPHKREQQPERRQASTSPAAANASIVFPTASLTSTSSATTTGPAAVADMPVPTIPSFPPPLPTPFPQPFRTDLSANFSLDCYNFFVNMTAALPFRSCRPLSLLMDKSDSFLGAQQNLTLMNSIIWGTCNTDISEDQCHANMGWFTDALQKACAQDLQTKNEMAVSTLRDLQAYSLIRKAGCLTNPAANTYCYLDAVQHGNLYLYTLPLGLPVPNTTELLCTACSRDLMSLYYTTLSNSTEAPTLTGLQRTYEVAAKLTVAECGTAFANTTLASTAPAAVLPGQWTGLAVLLLGMILS